MSTLSARPPTHKLLRSLSIAGEVAQNRAYLLSNRLGSLRRYDNRIIDLVRFELQHGVQGVECSNHFAPTNSVKQLRKVRPRDFVQCLGNP